MRFVTTYPCYSSTQTPLFVSVSTVKMELVVGNISLHVNCIHFRGAVFVFGFRFGFRFRVLRHVKGLYGNPSVLSLSLDRSKQSDSPNGKITPEVLFPLMPKRHFLVKFWKCKKAVSVLPHEAKHCWNYCAFNQSYLAKGKTALLF